MIPKTFRNSLNARLLTGYAAVLLLSMTLISGYVYLQVRRDLTQNMRDYLTYEFYAALERIQSDTQDVSSMSNVLSRQTVSGKGPNRISYALFDDENRVIARTEGFSEDIESVNYFGRARITSEGDGFYEHAIPLKSGKRMYVITQPFRDRSGARFYLQYGMDNSHIAATMRTLAWTIVLAIPIILLIALIGGFVLTRRLLAPIGALGDAARELSLTDPQKELPVRGTGDELDRLSITFNEVFKQLRSTHQRMVQFTADASHELRLPITAIKGEAEVVLGRERSLEEYRKVLGNIIEEFDRLSRMVSQLLTLTRADSGQDKVVHVAVDLSQLIRKLCEFYQPLAEEKDITLHFKSTAAPELKGDSEKLQELFSNLLENAVKYTPSGGNVKADVGLDGENVPTVRIVDTGIGISADEYEKIFERFYRSEKSRSRAYGGVGLGLSIARTIAEAHGASIAVASKPGGGSTFTVRFPR